MRATRMPPRSCRYAGVFQLAINQFHHPNRSFLETVGDWERSPTHSQRTNEWAPGWHQLAFSNCVAMSVAHFVCFEVVDLIQTLSRFGLVATGWPRAVIAVLRMEMVIYVAMEAFRAMKPGARPNEDAACKPFRAIVPIRGAIVRRDIVVPIGTHRRNSDLNVYLSMHCGRSHREADSGNSN